MSIKTPFGSWPTWLSHTSTNIVSTMLAPSHHKAVLDTEGVNRSTDPASYNFRCVSTCLITAIFTHLMSFSQLPLCCTLLTCSQRKWPGCHGYDLCWRRLFRTLHSRAGNMFGTCTKPIASATHLQHQCPSAHVQHMIITHPTHKLIISSWHPLPTTMFILSASKKLTKIPV